MIQDYVAVDLEMTGINQKRDQILEIGAVKVLGGETIAEFQRLVAVTVPIPPAVTQLTGITDEMAARGEEIDVVMKAFLEFAGELPLVGHQLMCDYGFLKQWAVDHRVSFERCGVDTLKLARKFLPKDQKKSLPELCSVYGICGKSHRALFDAKAANEVLRKLAEEFEEQNPQAFVPTELLCSIKRRTPATKRQMEQLRRYIGAYGLEEEFAGKNWEQFSRSEASRAVDQIIFRFGKLERKREV